MSRRQLAALIAASALITLDGTATTIALPSIGTDLSSSLFQLQWISNAPLLILAALLLPGGTIADRFGRVRVIRIGLVVCVAAAVASLCAPNEVALTAARLVHGAGGALVLPASLALLRNGYSEAAERTRIFGCMGCLDGGRQRGRTAPCGRAGGRVQLALCLRSHRRGRRRRPRIARGRSRQQLSSS